MSSVGLKFIDFMTEHESETPFFLLSVRNYQMSFLQCKKHALRRAGFMLTLLRDLKDIRALLYLSW